MAMTAALLRQLRPEIEAALADLGEKYGIGFEVGDANMGVRFLTGGESSPNGIIGLDFVLERSVNEDATTGIAPATKSVAEKGGFNV